MDALLSVNLWTVIGSAMAGFAGAITPILVARYNARQEAEKAKAAIRTEAMRAHQDAAKLSSIAKAETLKVAEEAKSQARKDALDEWQKLYGAQQQRGDRLEADMLRVRSQNADQQQQLNALKDQHELCERGRAEDKAAADRVHAELNNKIEALKGTVSKIANGGTS